MHISLSFVGEYGIMSWTRMDLSDLGCSGGRELEVVVIMSTGGCFRTDIDSY